MIPKLEKLKAHSSIFRLKEAKRYGLSRQDINYYTKRGFLERVGHGVYRFKDIIDEMDLYSELNKLLLFCPHCVVGLDTALKLYGLTDEISAEVDLLAPTNNIPKRKLEGVHIHTTPPKLMKMGVTQINGIAVTTLERTIIDLLRKDKPLSFVLNVLRSAQKKGIGIELIKVQKLGYKFRVSKKVQALLEAFL
ncbi:MAG: hypothetical protein A2583_14905 [Bdellovibrionales bacterium RIFOXYD1_FULL_53_11]|nr:MAG: hypothetical protein A2583_14905 [Bdellovibrionales bacterium RIFOXYD1_FULL_53_11]